ncbi:DUF3895 domain-containing protein [Bacillus cereus]|uniref:DUF3895 domain-containing protein n=1 Tax=Bacillus cereus TaxID=1396 RepID=UPI002406E9F7|nr:DUF3895 domain-containing protein [Bacillus cereus]MDF9525104.1 DUF3895 domain-containing protein [Bacillus cereus]MDF9565127.1 DUF3895 domain-containing protein [Bacillus cereus]
MYGTYLDLEDRDKIMGSLSDEQQDYLHNFLKRGKRTAFASVLARLKGDGLEENAEHISTQWMFIEYIDAGKVSNEHPCECGRPLRYQYIVKNLVTNKILKFGKDHFERHTGLPSSIVKAVLKGMYKIDCELDEILNKISSGWSLFENLGVSSIPDDLIMPIDIREHLELDLPLLDRQLMRLKGDLRSYNSFKKNIVEKNDSVDFEINEGKEEGQASLFDEDIVFGFDLDDDNVQTVRSQPVKVKPISIEKNISYQFLSFVEQEFILQFIQNVNSVSVRQLCEFMIKEVGSLDKRYLTGKPHIYVHVCSYLDFLVTQGKLSYIENLDYIDRIYYIESDIS